MIYSSSIADRLLACYLQEPSLLLNSKYPLDKDEFIIQFQKILYVVIYNLAVNGCKSISIMDIEEWLKPYTAQYNVYKENNGDEYISTVIELVDYENFESYYKHFRKFSCLREYKEYIFYKVLD